MIQVTKTRALSVAMASHFLLSGLVAHAQLTEFVSVLVNKYPDGGSTPYGLWTSAGGVWLGGGALVAPDGTLFGPGGIEDGGEVSGLASAELVNRFAGQWTINDPRDVPANQPAEQYVFSVSSSDLLNGFPTTPDVTFPTDGAVVPRVFQVTTVDTNPAGVGLKVYPGPVQFDPVDGDTVELTVLFDPGVEERVMGIRASDANYSPFRSATPLGSSSSRSFLTNVGRHSYSNLTTVTVLNIPEPSTGTLAFSLAAAAVMCGKKLHKRWNYQRWGRNKGEK